MPKALTYYVCSNCSKRTTAFMGRCPQCHEFGTMEQFTETPEVETKNTRAKQLASVVGGQRLPPRRLAEVDIGEEPRLQVPVEEFSRVMGGGIVPGSITLIAGEPGVGKTTLLSQISTLLANVIGKVLYVSGEESTRQIRMRADRLGLAAEELFLVTETSLEAILEHANALSPRILIVDSIQTTFSDDKPSAAGTVTQVRECAARLQMLAKSSGIAVFLVGHVTKDGTIAGPRVLEHIVDTVLYLEGDPFHTYRLLRSVKNRFGATSEVGVFEMRGSGLVEVTNPSEAFLAERVTNAPGSTILVTMEGTRPLLVEVQALASPTTNPNPRRTPNGVDFNRLQLLTAVLTRRVGMRLAEQDVFVNVIGGLTVDEPAADLAIAVSIASSYWDAAVPSDLVIVGEVGLSGELRAVGQLPARLKEASKLGFKRAIIPKSTRSGDPLPKGIQVHAVRSVYEALSIAVPREKKGEA
jgi:DNA repair protein RadA/Sms